MDTTIIQLYANAAHDPDDIAQGYNGAKADIDLVTPQTFINDKNLIVLTDANQMDLLKTISHRLLHLANTLMKTRVSTMSADELAPVMKDVGVRIAQFELLALLSKAYDATLPGPAPKPAPKAPPKEGAKPAKKDKGKEPAAAKPDEPDVPAPHPGDPAINVDGSIRMTFRRSDRLTLADYTAKFDEMYKKLPQQDRNGLTLDNFITEYERMAKILVAHVRGKDGKTNPALGDAGYVTKLIFANSIHRHGSAGHNFYTAKVTDPTSVASRAVRVAGALTDQFIAFCRDWGHDLWHLLTDSCLKNVADAISGERKYTLRDGAEYNGVNVANQNLNDVLKLDEAITDRYPPGTIGIGGLVIGLSAAGGMLTEIGLKARCDAIPELSVALTDMKEKIGNYPQSRTDLLRLRTILGPTLAVALGYMKNSKTGGEILEDHLSAKALINAHPEKDSLGSQLFTAMAKIEIDPLALDALLHSVMEALASSVRNYNALKAGIANEMVNDVTAATGVKVATSSEVAKRRQAAADAHASITNAGLNPLQIDYA